MRGQMGDIIPPGCQPTDDTPPQSVEPSVPGNRGVQLTGNPSPGGTPLPNGVTPWRWQKPRALPLRSWWRSNTAESVCSYAAPCELHVPISHLTISLCCLFSLPSNGSSKLFSTIKSSRSSVAFWNLIVIQTSGTPSYKNRPKFSSDKYLLS